MLSALVLRSKSHWGYDDAFHEACRDELAISTTDMTARRIVVAQDEESGELLGVASFEGEAPDGTLGLLFVEPHAIGRGIGRTLYAHVLDAARDADLKRLTIDSDPHAVDFCRALGARPVSGGGPLSRLRVEVLPRQEWVRAWTGALRTVQLGNVAEFQAQFGPLSETGRLAGGHYSCLAAPGSPHPAVIVLPRTVPPGWIELLSRQLAWGAVELYDGVGPGAQTAPVPAEIPTGLTAELLTRTVLTAHLRGLGLPFVPWGHTAASGELSGRPLPPGALRYESKRAPTPSSCCWLPRIATTSPFLFSDRPPAVARRPGWSSLGPVPARAASSSPSTAWVVREPTW